jgi:hypothetical protein
VADKTARYFFAPHLPTYSMTRRLLSSLSVASSLCALLLTNPAAAQRSPFTGDKRTAIKEVDLKRDLFAIGGDHFRGREGGTLNELRASMWIAEQLRAIGLQPAGDDGTYFQYFHIQRTRLTPASTLRIGSHQLRLNQDAVVVAPTNANVAAPLIYVGTATPAEVAKVDIKGKAVALQISGAPTDGISYRRYLFAKLRDQAADLMKGGAVAVVFISDGKAQAIYDQWSHI